MRKTLFLALALAAITALTLTSFAQDEPKEKPELQQPDPLSLQRDKMIGMKDLLIQVQQHLAAGGKEEEKKAVEKFEKFEALYRDVELGKITNRNYKEQMLEIWKVAQETVVIRLREIAPEMFKEKSEDKPAAKPDEKPKVEQEQKPEEKKEDKGSTTPGGVVKTREGAQYYPIEAGMAWTYRSGRAQALVNVSRKEKFKGKDCFVIDTISGAKMVQRQWLHINDEGIFALKDWQRDKVAEYETPFPIAKFPFKKGQKWKWVGKMFGKTVSYSFHVKGEKTVTVPAGTFTGLEVESLINPGGIVIKVMEVFAPGVGLVYQEREVIGRKEPAILELVKYTPPEGKKDE